MTFDNVKNYYEHLVFEEIVNQTGNSEDENTVSDIACVALNHLPPRYYRHDVDMAFYLSPIEREETLEKVKQAVTQAIDFIKNAKR